MYVYRHQNCGKIVISDFVLPSGRGVVKIWGLLFFGIFSKFLSESVQPPVRMIYDKKSKIYEDRSL